MSHPIQTALKKAVNCQKQGRLDEAERLYRRILKAQPAHPDALHLLGLILFHRGDCPGAERLIRDAIRHDGKTPLFHLSLGNVCSALGRTQEAIGCYEAAARLGPHLFQSHFNLGNEYVRAGDLPRAVEHYRKALEKGDREPDVHYNLGCALLRMGQYSAALEHFDRALQLRPDDERILLKRGSALLKASRLDDAERLYRRLIDQNPLCAEAYHALCLLLRRKNELAEAEDWIRRLIGLNPHHAEAYCTWGHLLHRSRRINEAIEKFEKALSLDPRHIQSHLGMAHLLSYEKGDLDRAEDHIDRILDIDRRHLKALYLKAMVQFKVIYPDQETIHRQRERYAIFLKQFCEAIDFDRPDHVHQAAEALSLLRPFYLPYQGYNDRELQQTYGEAFSGILSRRHPEYARKGPVRTKPGNERIRVGFASAYYHYHSNWKIPISGWVENLDRDRFELYGYYLDDRRDTVTQSAIGNFHRFVPIEDRTAQDMARIIAGDRLDILVYPEIGMHPVAMYLAAMRLAPVQCNSWGHPNTSGFPTIDYFISSDLMEPPNGQDFYTEQLIRLPNLSIHYTPIESPCNDISCSIPGADPDDVIYLSSQSLYKYLPAFDDIYPLIALKRPKCKFLFISDIREKVQEVFQARIRRAFERYGLQASRYVIFMPRLNFHQFRSINRFAHVFLDTIGWSGCNSALETLEFNTPIVTLPALTMRSRHSYAILKMMDVLDTVADSVEGYVDIACRLAESGTWRSEVSGRIEENKHRVYKDMEPVKALEDFFEGLVRG